MAKRVTVYLDEILFEKSYSKNDYIMAEYNKNYFSNPEETIIYKLKKLYDVIQNVC